MGSKQRPGSTRAAPGSLHPGDMPTIALWDEVGLGVIVTWPSGVLYSNQTGGTACFHPSAEGVFIPLRNDLELATQALLSPSLELNAYFEGPKHQGTGARDGLDSEDARWIDTMLDKWGLSCSLAVDSQRLNASHEAWVHMILSADDGQPCPLFQRFSPYPRPAILTWPNSD